MCMRRVQLVEILCHGLGIVDRALVWKLTPDAINIGSSTTSLSTREEHIMRKLLNL